MRRMILLGCALLSCGSPSTARAELMAWQGTLSIALVGSPPLSVDVGGVAVAIDTGNGVTLRTLRPLGTSGGTATFLITDPEAIGSQLFAIQLQVDEVGFATLSPFNPPAPSTQLQLDRAELPLRGILRFCFLSSSCGTGLDVPLSIGHGSSGVGVGGTLTGSYAGESLSIEAAPWTVRTASLTAHTGSGALVTLVTQGSLHGANSFTGTTAITGGELSLVTPLRLIASGGPPTPAFARLSMRFVPEPGLLLLFGAGVSGLWCLRKLRGRGGRVMRSSISAARSPWIQGALEPVLSSLALMTCVWLLLLVPALLPEALRPPAVLAAYAVALAVTLALAPRRRRSEAAGASALPSVGLGLAAGLLSYPAWISISLLLGLSLGLPVGSPTPPWPGAPWTWSIALLLAPALEELLYRDRVLPVLSEHWGAAAGIVVTSACFALPHLEPWAVLVCFELGLVAGVLRLAARSVAPCIGLHAGLNLASLAFGVPGFDLHPLGPATGALLGSAALLGAVCLARRPLRLRTSARTAIRTSPR